MARFLLLFAAGLASSTSFACMWDYDTFAAEAEGKHDLVAVIAGRFERNPPLYYEMRLGRSLADLKTQPTNLDLYDNAAVAAERLGRTEEALQINRHKREKLKPLPADKTHWYRYFANKGTFHAHKALKLRDKARTKELKLAEADIAKAIEINPDAHFGRERYQLYAIQWLLKGQPEGKPLWDWLNERDLIKHGELDAPIKGYMGLVRLGNAWESVDIWGTLGVLLSRQRRSSVGDFAYERARELERAGKTSLVPGEGFADSVIVEARQTNFRPMPDLDKQNAVIYQDLRKQAEQWHQNRTAYMMERLKVGRHPDWDKQFWSEWKDEPKLKVPKPSFIERIPYDTRFLIGLWAFLALLLITPIVLFVSIRRRRKRKLAAAPPREV